MKYFQNKETSNLQWNIKHVEDIPLQVNNFDCGVYICQFAKCLSRGMEIPVFTKVIDLYNAWLRYICK